MISEHTYVSNHHVAHLKIIQCLHQLYLNKIRAWEGRESSQDNYRIVDQVSICTPLFPSRHFKDEQNFFNKL